MSNENIERVKELIVKAAKAERSEDAMRFSQAACNCSGALSAVAILEKANAGDEI